MKRLFLISALFLFSFALFAQEEVVTITVEQAVDYAQKYSRSIRKTAIDVDSKKDSRNHALNAFLPDISFSAALSRPNESSIKTESSLGSYSATGSASISLNWGLSIIEKVKKANRDYEAGLISWEQTIKQNNRDIKKLFYNLLLQQKSLENDRATLENTKARYESTEKKYRSGNAPKFDVLQSKVTYQNMKRDVDNASIALSRQLREFAVILGFKPDTKIALSGSLETEIVAIDREKLLSAYNAYSSDIKLIEMQIDSLDYQMKALNYDSWTPTLSFGYSTKPTLTGIDNDWLDSSNWHDKGSMSFSLTWNFTDSSKLFDELETSSASLASCRENIALAEESYSLVSRAYNAGSADLIEVSDAEMQLNKSRLAEQSELYTYLCALTDLEYMLDLPEGWNK